MSFFESNLPKGWIHSKFCGYTVYHLKNEDILRQIKQGAYEKRSVNIVSEWCSEGNVGFDIGANIGLFSLQLLETTNKKPMSIYAFEPNPSTFARFFLTVTKNNLFKHITPFPLAFSNSSNIQFFALHDPLSCSGDGFLDTGRAGSTKNILVQTATIDDFVIKSSLSRLDWMKIDIEGAELLALNGGKETIMSYRPKVLLEINRLNIKPYKISVGEIYNYFSQNNYEIFDTKYNKLDQEMLISNVLHGKGDDNYLALPK